MGCRFTTFPLWPPLVGLRGRLRNIVPKDRPRAAARAVDVPVRWVSKQSPCFRPRDAAEFSHKELAGFERLLASGSRPQKTKPKCQKSSEMATTAKECGGSQIGTLRISKGA